jgi:hypothetical protein
MTEFHAAPGPYDSDGEATAAVAHILASREESWTDGNLRLLEDACRAAGVELGAYDHQALMLLATASPRICAAFAGIITRAAEPSLSPLQQLMGPPGVAQPSGGGMISGPMGGGPS